MTEPLSKEQVDGLIARYGRLATLDDVEQGEAQRRGEVPYRTRYLSHQSAMEALRSLPLPDGILPSLLPSSGGHSFQQWQLQLCPVVEDGQRATTAVYSGDYPNGAWLVKSPNEKGGRFADLSAAIEHLIANPIAEGTRIGKDAVAHNPMPMLDEPNPQ